MWHFPSSFLRFSRSSSSPQNVHNQRACEYSNILHCPFKWLRSHPNSTLSVLVLNTHDKGRAVQFSVRFVGGAEGSGYRDLELKMAEDLKTMG